MGDCRYGFDVFGLAVPMVEVRWPVDIGRGVRSWVTRASAVVWRGGGVVVFGCWRKCGAGWGFSKGSTAEWYFKCGAMVTGGRWSMLGRSEASLRR